MALIPYIMGQIRSIRLRFNLHPNEFHNNIFRRIKEVTIYMDIQYQICSFPDVAGGFCQLETDIPCFAAVLHNETVLSVPETDKRRLMFVLQGELDCIVNSWPLRLTAGSWVTLPAEAEASVHVYRSIEDVQVILFSAAQSANGGPLAFGNAWDMPEAETQHRLFAFEGEFLTGQLIVNGGTCQVTGPAVVLNLKGTCHLGSEALCPGAFVRVADGCACEVTGADGAVVFLRYGHKEVEDYKQWMNETYAICWDSGLHHNVV